MAPRRAAISFTVCSLALACGTKSEDGRASGDGGASITGITSAGGTDSVGDDGSGGGGSGDGGSGGGTQGEAEADSGDIKFDMGIQPDINLGCDGGGGGGGGTADFSYIWIANSNESTVSKINTETLIEEGRYITRPDSNGNPSRTSVNLNGDMAIGNRNGGVTMIYALHDNCPDPNNTSSGP
ncbi:MAG: hypothetical protein K1X88_21605, partial [Nannocystaceae bacterium]|nr:hypothetical protein [Nannocystaceae bacterium]